MAQITQRNDFTYRLIEKYIRPGMHVLDVGCGNGELSFLIADVVGDAGKVDGVDMNRIAIDAALKQQQETNRQNVTFSVSDINALDGGQYDAVFGRRVLMYQEEPFETIQTLKKLLKPGGVMLFQESDEMGARLNDEALPLHNKVQDWIWQTVKHEGGKTHIGSVLYGLMKAASLQIVDYCSEAVLQTAETGSDLAWVTAMMQERMRAAGVHPEMDGLEERLNTEMQTANRAFVRDLAFGICAKNA